LQSLVWVAALIVPALGPAFSGAARVDPPLFDGGVAGWFCDGGAIRAPLPIDVFKSFADSPTGGESLDKDGPDACAAFLDSSAYAFAAASAGAGTFRVPDPFGPDASEASADARGDRGAGRCCHGAREKFRLAVSDPIFGNSAAVPEPPTCAILLVGFAGVGLAACARAIANRVARPAPIR
jgi:hypothetical protein